MKITHAPAPARSIGVSLGWGPVSKPQQFAISTLLDASPVGKVCCPSLRARTWQFDVEGFLSDALAAHVAEDCCFVFVRGD